MDTNLDSPDLRKRITKKNIKFHELDAIAGEDQATKIRLQYLEDRLRLKLTGINSSLFQPRDCKANIENMIGAVQVPIGVAGPVSVHGTCADGTFFLPLATTEGSLVASVNRGCSVINKAGGAAVTIVADEQTRSLLFKTSSITAVHAFITWVKNHFLDLKDAGELGTRFLAIKDIACYVVGLNVWVMIKANTHDAMGMNMITIAGKKIADHIISNYKDIEFVSESGNMCVDKKPSAMNLVNSRGKRVVASVTIPTAVVRDVLKTSTGKLIDMNYRKNLLGSAAAGSLGYNAHFANIVAALFIATGQDVAHTVEGSLGFTTVEKNTDGVTFSVTLTALHVGTVGGGTGLQTQRECLSILGVEGAGTPPGTNAKRLAEIIAVAVLAGEISLLGALCTQDLSKAHQELNR